MDIAILKDLSLNHLLQQVGLESRDAKCHLASDICTEPSFRMLLTVGSGCKSHDSQITR